jgi:hypothetical protein
MNDTLLVQNFLLLPHFISSMRAQALAHSLDQYQAQNPLAPDTLVPNAPSVYDFLPYVRLLIEKIPAVETAAQEKVLPTYTYARIYSHGDSLPMHQDRDACELSLSLCLDSDTSWPIWLKTPLGKDVPLQLQPGDAVMYLGCQTPHWREPFEGRRCTQLFMHYVFAYGDRAYAYFDKHRQR